METVTSEDARDHLQPWLGKNQLNGNLEAPGNTINWYVSPAIGKPMEIWQAAMPTAAKQSTMVRDLALTKASQLGTTVDESYEFLACQGQQHSIVVKSSKDALSHPDLLLFVAI